MFKSILESSSLYFQNIVGIFTLTNIREFLSKVIVLVLSIFAPIAAVIHAILFLIVVDLLTGVLSSFKHKESITSAKLSRTISKILVYTTSIMVTYIVTEYLVPLDFGVSLTAVVSGFIAITELKSILENLNKLCGKTAIKDVILYLSNERNRKVLGPKTCKDCPLLKLAVEEKKQAINKKKPGTKKQPRKKQPEKSKPKTTIKKK